MDKVELRKSVKGKAVSREESEGIVRNILSLDEFKKADGVMMFSPLKDEPDITPLFALKKTIALPVVHGKEMWFCIYTGATHKGAFSINEPLGKPFIPQNGTIIIVPGQMFSESGIRLGRGFAYYDRYLSAHPDLIKIGVAPESRVLDCLPTESHDIQMDIIVTEKRIIVVKK